MDSINHRSITRSLSLSLLLTILARNLISWQITLFQNIPTWHFSCIGFPNPVSDYFHHCTKTGDPAEQQTAFSRLTPRPSPRLQLREHTVQLNPTWTGLKKYLVFVSPKSWNGSVFENTSRGLWERWGGGILARVHLSVGRCQTRQAGSHA